MKLTVGHLYPDVMNIYADRGNIIALACRCLWRNIDFQVIKLSIGDRLDPDQCGLYFIGGGQDKEQQRVCEDLVQGKGAALIKAVEEGAVLLAVCGGYQLLGKYYETGSGKVMPGLGLFDAYTKAGPRRRIGDVIVECTFTGDKRTLVGFENHSGRTHLGKGVRPLGRVLFGHGNNGDDHSEGAIYENAYGTYLHGSLLPKNPWFADHLLLTALRRLYGENVTLEPLDNSLEELAHAAIVRRIHKRGRLNTGVT